MKQETKQPATPSPSIHEEGKFTKGEWKFDGIECICSGDEVIADIRPCNHEGEEVENQVYHRSKEEAEANAALIAAAPEMFKMIIDLKNCIKRLTSDDLSQYDKDTEAQWEGEAHELLTRINPNYYKNANEK